MNDQMLKLLMSVMGGGTPYAKGAASMHEPGQSPLDQYYAMQQNPAQVQAHYQQPTFPTGAQNPQQPSQGYDFMGPQQPEQPLLPPPDLGVQMGQNYGQSFGQPQAQQSMGKVDPMYAALFRRLGLR